MLWLFFCSRIVKGFAFLFEGCFGFVQRVSTAFFEGSCGCFQGCVVHVLVFWFISVYYDIVSMNMCVRVYLYVHMVVQLCVW